MHFPHTFCVVMYCAVNNFYPYIHVGIQAQFFKKSFNLKMVARKETNKKTPFEGRIFHVALHKVFSVGEPDDMIETLLFANLVCSLSAD